jgi:hypothetical protein
LPENLRDNSVNHHACNAGITAWWASCQFLSGFFTGGAFTKECDDLAATMRSSCPPAMICVL